MGAALLPALMMAAKAVAAPAPPPPPPLVVVIVAPPAMPPPLINIAAPPAPPPEIPQGVRAVIEAAIASGDPAAVTAVVRFAKQTNPQVTGLIDEIDAGYRRSLADAKARAERERIARLENATMFQLWKGSVELGASRQTGNTDSFGLYGALTGEREGILWRHKIEARADFQRVNDATTTRRGLASWQPQYKFGDRLYAYGVASFEHDRPLGYEARYTAGIGVGYGLVRSDRLRIDLEGGPALRHTDAVIEPTTTAVAGRGSFNMRWQIAPDLQFAQTASIYLEPGDSSATTSTSLDTKLIGALKARFSYDVKYERNTPVGNEPVDTSSRATLVYSF